VVDAAPTGETLRLLSLPEVGKWWIEKIYPIQRRIAQVTGPIVGRVLGMPMPSNAVYSSGEELFGRLEHMHDLLADPELTSIRLVLNLEKMVIKEAQRAFTYFNLYGYPTDLVICNRIVPDNAGPYFEAWRQAQARYWPEVQADFDPIPIRRAPFFEREVVGMPMLRELGAAVFEGEDPTAFYYRGHPYSVRREDGAFVLTLELPFTSKDEVRLHRNGDELVVQVGWWRRNLILPRALVDLPTSGAGFDDHVLKVRFAAGPHSQAGASKR